MGIEQAITCETTMPSYSYDCPRCGTFHASRPMAEYDQPHTCPQCGTEAPRALDAPGVVAGGGARADAADYCAPKAHGGGCGCCGGAGRRGGMCD